MPRLADFYFYRSKAIKKNRKKKKTKLLQTVHFICSIKTYLLIFRLILMNEKAI